MRNKLLAVFRTTALTEIALSGNHNDYNQIRTSLTDKELTEVIDMLGEITLKHLNDNAQERQRIVRVLGKDALNRLDNLAKA